MNKIAIVFPGQGSQSHGMLSVLSEKYPNLRSTIIEASEALDMDLWGICEDGPAETLNQTEITQPALLAASVGVWRELKPKLDVEPTFLAGHSLGEYSALVAAQAIQFKDAVRLVHMRGCYMRDAQPGGVAGMLAIIGLDEPTVKKVCDEARENDAIDIANLNAKGQIVVAGHKSALERAIPIAKSHGAKLAKLLPMSVPSHSSLMEPAAKNLEGYLSGIKVETPKYPVLANVDVEMYETPEQIKAGLVKQLISPVRWVETVKKIADADVAIAYECGPGKVLAGLIKRTDSRIETR